ncbi:hypothetical protein JCM16303_006208 [Sporobolomyces ruberrimus]
MTSYELYSSGSNSHGQLGIGSDEDSSTYTRVSLPPDSKPLKLAFGANHSLLLAEVDGRRALYGTGSNASRQLGLGETTARFSFEALDPKDFLPPGVNLGSEDYEIVGIAATWSTSFVHLRRRSVPAQGQECMSDILVSLGSNDWGERGIGSEEGEGGKARLEPTIVSMAEVVEVPVRIVRLVAGPRHVLALLESLDPSAPSFYFVGWGASRQGQLGAPHSHTKLPRLLDRPTVVPLPAPFSPRDVVEFACGKDHSVVFLNPHASTSTAQPTVLTLGSNKHGQLGPDLTNPSSSNPTSLERLNALPIPTLNPTLYDPSTIPALVTVCATWNSTFITFPSSSNSTIPSEEIPSIISFGSNSHGQLGVPSPIDSNSSDRVIRTEPQQEGGNLRILKLDPKSLSSPRQLPDRTSQKTFPDLPPISKNGALRLVAGSEHLLAIVTPPSPLASSLPSSSHPQRQDLYTWGWNEHGNLGLGQGDLLDRNEPVRVGGVIEERLNEGEGGRIEGVWAGMATSWVLLSFKKEPGVSDGAGVQGED